MEHLKFNNTTQEIIFRYFFQFLGTLEITLIVDVKDNKAYIKKEGEVARLCVFPYKNDGLHFEFSRDLQKPFNSRNSIPVFVNSVAELENIKPATKVIFISAEAAKETGEPVLELEETIETTETSAEKKQNHSKKPSVTKKSVDKKSKQKTISKFF